MADSPEQWSRVREIFAHLADKSPSHRSDYLDMVCEDEPQLRAEVEALLAAHDKLGDDETVAAPLTGPTRPGPPRVIQGYAIVEVLGSGGMGAVYRAEHPVHGATALKLIPGFAVAEGSARARFEREANILRSVEHPTLCRIYESFVADDYAGIAMELVTGQELRSIVPVTPARAADIVVQLAEALGPLHAKGVVHRDLKPNNVLTTDTSAVKLIDFGIAKFADEKLTRTGQILGTPRYMSPEQWQGAPMDARTDLWALGCLLYELVSGRPAFDGKDMTATARAVLHDAPAPLALDVPAPESRALSAILTHLLAKSPEERIATCEALIAQLRGIYSPYP